MPTEETLISPHLKAPRAAAIAGILFSVLLITSFVLLRFSVPADPLEAGAWLRTRANTVALALNLVPFAGIAFLWFMGVLRDRLGEREDRFFATVFLGSGLLFLAMLFFSAAVAGGIIIAYVAAPDSLLGSATFTFARAITYEIMNVYAIKMAGVFMIATSTLALRTGFIARWISFLGYAVAVLLLLSSRYIEGILLVFPLWVLLVSLHILVGNLRGPSPAIAPELEKDGHDRCQKMPKKLCLRHPVALSVFGAMALHFSEGVASGPTVRRNLALILRRPFDEKTSEEENCNRLPRCSYYRDPRRHKRRYDDEASLQRRRFVPNKY